MPEEKQPKKVWLKTETAKAAQAFEEYYNLGPQRTLNKLLALYKARRHDGIPVPTSSIKTLELWCGTFNWPARAAERIREEYAQQRTRDQETLAATKRDIADMVTVSVRRLFNRMADDPDIVLVDSIDGLAKALALLEKAFGILDPLISQSIPVETVLQEEQKKQENNEEMMARAVNDVLARAIALADEEGGPASHTGGGTEELDDHTPDG